MDLGNVLSGFDAKYHLGWAEIRYLKLADGARQPVEDVSVHPIPKASECADVGLAKTLCA
jgi:hypothetical protein